MVASFGGVGGWVRGEVGGGGELYGIEVEFGLCFFFFFFFFLLIYYFLSFFPFLNK